MTDRHSAGSTRDGSHSFRCHVAARLSAIWLIVLVVSPWSEPFAIATSLNQASDNLTTVSSDPGTAGSTEDLTGSVTPPTAFRTGKLRLEHSIGERSVIGPVILTEVPLEESNRPSPPRSRSSAAAVLRL
jgi:hypothetical protein